MLMMAITTNERLETEDGPVEEVWTFWGNWSDATGSLLYEMSAMDGNRSLTSGYNYLSASSFLPPLPNAPCSLTFLLLTVLSTAPYTLFFPTLQAVCAQLYLTFFTSPTIWLLQDLL